MRTLVIETPGCHVGKHSERIQVRKGKEVILEIPFFRVREIIVARKGISLSTDLIEEACRRGIQLSFHGSGAAPFAMIVSPHLTATVKTRREQIRAYDDARGGQIGKAFVSGKLKNQANLLKYFGKYAKAKHPETYEALRRAAVSIERRRLEVRRMAAGRVDDLRSRLLVAEGDAGKEYWRGARVLLAQTDFVGREHRGAVDPTNALLNYGYGILYARTQGALLNAGLDPYAGFLHVDRSGKPALVLDFVEEFRQPIVDRAVFVMLNQGEAVKVVQGKLDDDTRHRIAAHVLERLESTVEFEGRKHVLGSIVQAQAYRLASAVRGEARYKTYRFRW